jgi:glycosyltransferase involved in cell wall biosynthesis
VRKRIVFINRFFHPDHSATSQILTDLAMWLSRCGEDVHVIASRQLYDSPAAHLPSHEMVQGVTVWRVAATRFGRDALLGRAFDLLSFYVVASWALYRIARRGDVVVAMTDPPLLSVAAAFIARIRDCKLVNWIQDLYPEIAVCLGMSWLKGAPGRILASGRNWSLERAAANVVIGCDMAGRLRSLGIPDSRVATISNWTDDEKVVPEKSSALRNSWHLGGKFVVAYSGNLGRAHDIGAFLEAAELLKDREDIAFVFIGGGQALKRLSLQLQERGISNVQFRPYQPRELLSQSLAVADLHWLSLCPGLDGLIVPSKFYGIAAAGRPMIVVSSPTMELASLVSQWDCGVAVLAGDGVAFARAVEDLARDPERCRHMGENARRMLDAHFTKAASLEKWRNLLLSVRDINE